MQPLFFLGGAFVLLVIIAAVLVATIKKFLITPETYNAYLRSSGKKLTVIRNTPFIFIPLFQRITKVPTINQTIDELIVISPDNNKIQTKITFDSVIAVGETDEDIRRAATRFPFENGDAETEMEKPVDIVAETIQNTLRGLVARQTVEELIENKDKFAEEVSADVSPILNKMGLVLVTLTIREVTTPPELNDGRDYISDLGEIKRQERRLASETAKAETDYAVKRAHEESERKKSEEATRTAETIAANEAKKAVALQKTETVRAEAQKATYRADELAKQEMLAESDRIKAEGRRRAEQEKADEEAYKSVRAAQAEKERAEFRLQAEELEAKRVKVAAEAEADAARSKAKAEAEAIALRGEAEAEAIQKRADAEKSLSDASLQVQALQMYPEVVKSAAAALGNTNMTVVSSDGQSGVAGMLAELIGVAKNMDLGKFTEDTKAVVTSNNKE
jgi:band 7 protein